MPQYLQGDVFNFADKLPCSLMVVFGRIGWNSMGLCWPKFREYVPNWANIGNPFTTLAGQPHQYNPDKWIWFFAEVFAEEGSHGMTDQILADNFERVMSWVHSNGIKTVITNGVANIDRGRIAAQNQESNDQRARYISQLMINYEQKYDIEILLINLSNVLVRNFT